MSVRQEKKPPSLLLSSAPSSASSVSSLLSQFFFILSGSAMVRHHPEEARPMLHSRPGGGLRKGRPSNVVGGTSSASSSNSTSNNLDTLLEFSVRDRTDATAKRGFRVQVPKRMLFYTILVFFVGPLVLFGYVEIHKAQFRNNITTQQQKGQQQQQQQRHPQRYHSFDATKILPHINEDNITALFSNHPQQQQQQQQQQQDQTQTQTSSANRLIDKPSASSSINNFTAEDLTKFYASQASVNATAATQYTASPATSDLSQKAVQQETTTEMKLNKTTTEPSSLSSSSSFNATTPAAGNHFLLRH